MADSFVNITEGSGTQIDTRTESTHGHHRQVVVVGDPANNDGVAPVDGSRGLAVNVWHYAPPAYEPTAIVTLSESGTVIPGVPGSVIVVEYHTQHNMGSADLTTTLYNGTVPFHQDVLPNTPGQNFLAWGAPFPGRELRCDPGTPFVVGFSSAGSVITNTRYWLEAAP